MNMTGGVCVYINVMPESLLSRKRKFAAVEPLKLKLLFPDFRLVDDCAHRQTDRHTDTYTYSCSDALNILLNWKEENTKK